MVYNCHKGTKKRARKLQFAHSQSFCISGMNHNYCIFISTLRPGTKFSVIAGTSRINRGVPTSTGVTVHVKRIVLHPEISFSFFNLALLELEQPLTFGTTIHPVCLSPQDDIPPGPCYATGWGRTSTYSKYRIKKDKVYLPQI